MSELAFGIAATAGPGVAAAVAPAIERLGYAAIWTNDTPGGDGIAVAMALLGATRSARVGIGVLPIDRRPPAAIVGALGHAARHPRLVVGIGSGGSAAPVADVRAALAALRRAGIGRIAVAALGPHMCRLAGEVADVVLLNWMTPPRIRWARRRIAEGRRGAGRPDLVDVASYVRVAVGAGARERLAAAAARYARIPAYARNFAAMRTEPGQVGVAIDDAIERVRAELDGYRAALDEVVVRALPTTWTPDEILRVARAASAEAVPRKYATRDPEDQGLTG